MRHSLEMFKQSKLKGLNTDSIPPAAYEDNFGQGRTHYYQSLLIGNEYRHDKGIRHLMKLEKEMMEDEGEVTYLAFGRHLEEIHVTWAHLEKKQMRLRTYTSIAQEFLLRSWRRRHKLHVTPTNPTTTASQDIAMASTRMIQPII
ncbi:hypothetical protein Tco_0939180 [Tanacetum coccineum]|uniref:Uncharacterized protein n=1 Tax=Tanacetum coccineum TaxID=301880 RepID=A0ABQ5DJC3_9ASTR